MASYSKSNPKLLQPTAETGNYWIYAKNGTSKNSQMPKENCAKWMLFEPYHKINKLWAMIKQETEMGRLGFCSKVSTIKDKDERHLCQRDAFVICVYIYDHTDEADVIRVREHLRKLGFTRKLPYKTDDGTYAGAYRSTTGGKMRKFYL